MPFGAYLLDRTVLRLSNASAKEDLSWAPAYQSYRAGVRKGAETSATLATGMIDRG